MTSRRLFLGSVAAAGVGAAGVTALDFSVPVSAQRRRNPPKEDAILKEIRKQLDLTAKEAKTPKAGTWQRGSSALLMFAAWAETNDVDSLLKEGIRRKGKTVLAYEMTRFRPEAELKHFGLTLPSAITITPGTIDDYERVIDGIMKEGIGPTLRGLAGVLQAAEEKGARREGILQVRRQLTPEQQAGCVRFKEQLLYAQITQALMCLMGPFFCGIYSFAYFTAQIAGFYYWQGLC